MALCYNFSRMLRIIGFDQNRPKYLEDSSHPFPMKHVRRLKAHPKGGDRSAMR